MQQINSIKNNLIVPTKDFSSNLKLGQILTTNNYSIMFAGNSFSGKSLQLNELVQLRQNNNKNKIQLKLFKDSNCIDIHKQMINKCHKAKKTYNFGKYEKNWIIIDDVNIPKRNVWGDRLTS